MDTAALLKEVAIHFESLAITLAVDLDEKDYLMDQAAKYWRLYDFEVLSGRIEQSAPRQLALCGA